MNWSECLKKLSQADYSGWPSTDIIRTGNPQAKDRFELTPTFDHPIWNGENSVLLVNADFGMGDTIHFWRYAIIAQKLVKKLYLRADSDFKSLLPNVVGKEDPLPDFDHICHMMALPKVLNNPPIEGHPYIEPIGECEIKLPNCFKIGICWSGNPYNPRDASRSIPGELFDLIRFKDGLLFFNLVKHYKSIKGHYDLSPYMNDWNATAHLVKQMDLVISVDTAIAHLAGAMGVPVWLLIPQDRDWRWNGTKWYNSMTVFQKTTDWEEVMLRIKKSLQDMDS